MLGITPQDGRLSMGQPNQNGKVPAPPMPDMSPEVAELIRLLHWAEWAKNLLEAEPEALDTGGQAGG